jgi:hypothetical protein
MQPVRPAVTAEAYRAAQSGDLGPRLGASSIARPRWGRWAPTIGRAGRDGGRCGAAGNVWLGTGYPWLGHTVTLLAGGAQQLVEGVHMPARSQCPCPVVRLAQGSQVGELRPAAWDVAAGGRQPDLIADDAVFGDRQRIKQRITAGTRPGCLVVRWWAQRQPAAARWRTAQSSLSHLACPAPHRQSARRDRAGMPRQRSRAHLPLPASCSCRRARQQRTARQEDQPRERGSVPDIFSSGAETYPACGTLNRRFPLLRRPAVDHSARRGPAGERPGYWQSSACHDQENPTTVFSTARR